MAERLASTHDRQVNRLISVSISYSWESQEHKAWVARLASALRTVGLKVKLDQSDLRPGSDLTAYMESAIRESDYVLLICTPDFAGRADRRLGGVGYEQAVVTGVDRRHFVELVAQALYDQRLPIYSSEKNISKRQKWI